MRPVRAGLEGGQFKPLDAESVKSIDATVYQILEEIGLSQAPVSGIEYMTGAGAVLGDDGRVRRARAKHHDLMLSSAMAAIFYDQMDNIHFFQRPMVARDILRP